MQGTNLLADPVLRMETPQGISCIDLPGLLAALGGGRAVSLPGLQRHQEDAVHVFLCYLAGAVLARQDRGEPTQDADFWRRGIRELTRADGGADDSAWTLVVEDPLQPAFMQPPPAGGDGVKNLRPKGMTPDALDVLPTAKNHDVKAVRAVRSDPEDWIFALVSLQTMSGYFGAGDYGVARMNRGSASRPVVELLPEGG